jgi:hypothetical protein
VEGRSKGREFRCAGAAHVEERPFMAAKSRPRLNRGLQPAAGPKGRIFVYPGRGSKEPLFHDFDPKPRSFRSSWKSDHSRPRKPAQDIDALQGSSSAETMRIDCGRVQQRERIPMRRRRTRGRAAIYGREESPSFELRALARRRPRRADICAPWTRL